MVISPKRQKLLLGKLVASIKQCSDQADVLNLVLGNGAEVGSLLGSIAEELEQKLAEAGQ